jgi:hypothetical protein
VALEVMLAQVMLWWSSKKWLPLRPQKDISYQKFLKYQILIDPVQVELNLPL